MIYRHKRSGQLYRVLMESFSVERQRSSVVYMGLETGEVFDRDGKEFSEGFVLLVGNVQDGIAPKGRDPELAI